MRIDLIVKLAILEPDKGTSNQFSPGYKPYGPARLSSKSQVVHLLERFGRLSTAVLPKSTSTCKQALDDDHLNID
jgi:hypothetical protein